MLIEGFKWVYNMQIIFVTIQIRMMEYERERRLRQRAKRIAAKNAAEGLDDE